MSLEASFSELVGKTLLEVEGLENGSEQVTFRCSDGTSYRMDHSEDCCESVNVEDTAGDVADIIGSPIVVAEESTSDKNPEGVNPTYQESFTWTFYKIDTVKGGVTIRWYGQSNGYYSESVDFARIK